MHWSYVSLALTHRFSRDASNWTSSSLFHSNYRPLSSILGESIVVHYIYFVSKERRQRISSKSTRWYINKLAVFKINLKAQHIWFLSYQPDHTKSLPYSKHREVHQDATVHYIPYESISTFCASHIISTKGPFSWSHKNSRALPASLVILSLIVTENGNLQSG